MWFYLPYEVISLINVVLLLLGILVGWLTYRHGTRLSEIEAQTERNTLRLRQLETDRSSDATVHN